MVFIRLLLLIVLLSGCQLGYYLHLGYNQLNLMNSKIPVEKALQDLSLNEDQKKKIKLTQDVRVYAFEKLGMKQTKNYSEYVQLNRPYVTYAVTASQKWKFEPYLWSFPFTGKAPYKGFFDEGLAKTEADELKKIDLDVSVRGVSAYSTLSYLTDPLLSSMLNYSEHQLTNTIFHELVHTTVFIKDNINFNERLAVFIANKSTERYYLEKEGSNSKTLKIIQNENEDDKIFSVFISEELKSLKKWYDEFDHSQKLSTEKKELIRKERLKLISEHFKQIKSQMKTTSYSKIFSRDFNNADLSMHDTYMSNLDVFEKAFKKLGSDIPKFLEKCKEIESSTNPESEMQNWI